MTGPVRAAAVVARWTLREAVRRKVVAMAAAAGTAFVALFAVGLQLVRNVTEREQAPQLEVALATTVLVVLGLYAVQFLAAVLAVLLSAGAVSGEESGARLHAVLARPLPRTSWLAGRAGALTGLAVVVAVGLSLCVLGLAAAIGRYQPAGLLRGAALLAGEVVVLATLATWASTRWSPVAAGAFVVALHGLAWVGGIVGVVGAALGQTSLERVATGVSLLVPTDALWRGASYWWSSPVVLAATSSAEDGIPFASTTPPSTWLLVWAVLYVAVLWRSASRRLARADL